MLSPVSIRTVILASCALVFGTCARPSTAALKVHYDPLNGNVSFDTLDTRSGSLYSYSLTINRNYTDVRFRPENFVRIFNSTLVEPVDRRGWVLGEGSFTNPVSGLFTIGNVLPEGWSEEIWRQFFVPPGFTNFLHADVIGGGFNPTEFIYGGPDREFDNRWDMVDPDSLHWAESARLIYRANTGELLLDSTAEHSGYTTIVLLKSADQFLPNFFTPPVESPFNAATTDTLAVIADAIEPGLYNLGSVLEAHMSREEFSQVLDKAYFVGRAGFGSNLQIDFEENSTSFTLVYQAVPEPASVWFMTSLLLTLARRRRGEIPMY